MATKNESLVKSFETALQAVDREGMDNLIDFIRKSDFYTAPASTKFHSSHEGGLLEHSWNVYTCLKSKFNNPLWSKVLADVPEDTIAIVSLLHDLCKTYYYTVSYRNVKNEQGQWEKAPYYSVDNRIPYGHGEKSVMMIEEYIKLTSLERYAIRWHMSYTEPKELWNDLDLATDRYPLVLALQEADQEATHLLEVNG